MLNVMIENSGNLAILYCLGRIVAGQETWTLFNAVESLKPGRVVVLDLTGVSGIDARGLGALLALKQWAVGAGVKLQLVPSNAVQELLDLTRLSSEFELRSPENFLVDSWEPNGISVAADD
jgi:anti-anti-sigma regulatory factor